MIIVYGLLGILLFPFALVLYVPCKAAYKGGKLVNDFLVSWHLQGKTHTQEETVTDNEGNNICSIKAKNENARIKCCSCFNFGRVISVGFTGLLCFVLGAILNLLIAPGFLILLLLCLPCFLVYDTIDKKRKVIEVSNSTLVRFTYIQQGSVLEQSQND